MGVKVFAYSSAPKVTLASLVSFDSERCPKMEKM